MRFSFPFPVLPASAWLQVALGSVDMLQSSSVVIAHRLGRLAAAGPVPNIRDRREFTRMVQEKPAAFAESFMAMMLRMTTLQMQQNMQLAQQMAVMGSSMLGWWTAPAALLSTTGQRQLAHQLMNAGLLHAGRRSRAAADILGSGLKPIRSRAAANAKRLVYRPARRLASKQT